MVFIIQTLLLSTDASSSVMIDLIKRDIKVTQMYKWAFQTQSMLLLFILN